MSSNVKTKKTCFLQLFYWYISACADFYGKYNTQHDHINLAPNPLPPLTSNKALNTPSPL